MAILESVSIDSMNSAMNPNLQSVEQGLRKTITSMGPNSTPADMLKMQYEMSKWTIQIQLQSTVVKEIGEACKGVVQKAA